MLTLKTLALIALSSSDRGQTLHSLNIDNMTIEDDTLCFVIFSRLKTTALKVSKPKLVRCVQSNTPELNVASYALAYIERTLPIRNELVAKGRDKPTQLFLSWTTKLPVKRNSLARWLKIILSLAGINTKQFSAHSFRGAGLSKAFSRGATLDQILKAGSWKRVTTFSKHCPSEDTPIGQIILHNLHGYVKSSSSLLLFLQLLET